MNTMQLTTLLLLLFMINGCKKEDDEQATCEAPIVSCLPDFEADPPGQWYKGDFHVHATGASNDTGGDSFPEAIKAKALSFDLDFLVLTDHSNSTGSDTDTTYENPALFNLGPEFPLWDKCAALTIPNEFLMIDGNEISPRHETDLIPTGHIGCIPINLENFNTDSPFIDRPMSTIDGANTIQQARDRDCFVVLNHAYSPFPWIAFDWTSFDYDAIEVWNGTLGYDSWDQRTRNAWICDLLNGKEVAAVGGSDNHRVNEEAPGSGLDPALAHPATFVFASSLAWQNIIDGLDQGMTMISEGESRLLINGYNDQLCHHEDQEMQWIRLRGQLDMRSDTATLELHHHVSCNDPRPAYTAFPELTTNVVFATTVIPGESFDYKIEVDPTTGVYTSTLLNNSSHYHALSRAIVIK